MKFEQSFDSQDERESSQKDTPETIGNGLDCSWATVQDEASIYNKVAEVHRCMALLLSGDAAFQEQAVGELRAIAEKETEEFKAYLLDSLFEEYLRVKGESCPLIETLLLSMGNEKETPLPLQYLASVKKVVRACASETLAVGVGGSLAYGPFSVLTSESDVDLIFVTKEVSDDLWEVLGDNLISIDVEAREQLRKRWCEFLSSRRTDHISIFGGKLEVSSAPSIALNIISLDDFKCLMALKVDIESNAVDLFLENFPSTSSETLRAISGIEMVSPVEVENVGASTRVTSQRFSSDHSCTGGAQNFLLPRFVFVSLDSEVQQSSAQFFKEGREEELALGNSHGLLEANIRRQRFSPYLKAEWEIMCRDLPNIEMEKNHE